jgi:hypothetical protein
MLRSRRWTIVLLLVLLCSLTANAVLAWLVRQQHRGMVRVRLDPTSEAHFVKLNAELQAPKAGEKRIVLAGASRMEMWRRLPSIADCQLVNRGRSSDTSGQLRLRLQRDVIDLHPDVVFKYVELRQHLIF